MKAIWVVGGGPAGSAAAIAALSYGAAVPILEKSRAPHHKVCGEFLAAETCHVLEELGLARAQKNGSWLNRRSDSAAWNSTVCCSIAPQHWGPGSCAENAGKG